jgi:hypothetical protein
LRLLLQSTAEIMGMQLVLIVTERLQRAKALREIILVERSILPPQLEMFFAKHISNHRDHLPWTENNPRAHILRTNKRADSLQIILQILHVGRKMEALALLLQL